MANPQLYEAAREKFRNTYGMPRDDLKELGNIDKKFTFLNNTENSTSAEKYVRLASITVRKYFESMTDLQAGGTKKLKGFSASKFLQDFEELAKASYESELEGEDKGNRQPYAGAKKEDLKKAFKARVAAFNKPLPNLWKEQMQSGYLKIEDARMTMNALFDKLTAKDAKKEELGGALKDIIAEREAVRQLRESRKGFRGFFWKLFNREQNNQEKDLLELLEYNVNALQDTYHYDVDGVFSEATQETPWGENAFYRTGARDFSSEKEIKAQEVDSKQVDGSKLDETRIQITDDQLKADVNGKDSQEKSEVKIDEKKAEVPSLDGRQ